MGWARFKYLKRILPPYTYLSTVFAFRLIVLIFFVLAAVLVQAQTDTLLLSTWPSFDVADSHVDVAIDSSDTVPIERAHTLAFTSPGPVFLNGSITPPATRYRYFYRLLVRNDRPDSAYYFVTASPQRSLAVAVAVRHQAPHPAVLTQRQYRSDPATQVAYVSFAPGEIKTLYIQLKFPHYTPSNMFIWLVEQRSEYYFFTYQIGFLSRQNTFSWFFCGMLLMMFLYIALKYVQLQTREYLYYAGYIFFFLLYFGLKLLVVSGHEWLWHAEWYNGFVNDQLQTAGYVMYFLFFQQFLQTRSLMPDLHRFMSALVVALLIYIVFDWGLFFFPDTLPVKETMWDVIRVALVLITLYCIWRTSRTGSPLGKYLIIGGLLLAVFALAAMVFSFSPDLIDGLPSPFHWGITYFQIGVAGELICFALGLGYKNRQDEIQKLQAEEELRRQEAQADFERYKTMTQAREAERGRIAKDLHDGLGGMLTGVRLSLANVSASTAAGASQLKRSLDMLDGSVYELRRIAQDLMPLALQRFGLVSALRDYTASVGSMGTVGVAYQTLGDMRRLTADHELICFRLVQELVNNALKHARAKTILVQLAFQAAALELTVEDDGVGFEVARLPEAEGSGWSNIHSRVSYLKGTVDIQTRPGEGVSVHIFLPI